jgi:hypothetical protein
MTHELEISKYLKYRFVSFTIGNRGMIEAVVEELHKTHSEDWTLNTEISFAGNNKGRDFWIPAMEAAKPELGHLVPNKLDEQIGEWLKDVYKEIL